MSWQKSSSDPTVVGEMWYPQPTHGPPRTSVHEKGLGLFINARSDGGVVTRHRDKGQQR